MVEVSEQDTSDADVIASVVMLTTPRMNVYGTPYARSDCFLHSNARYVFSIGRTSRFDEQQVDFVFGKWVILPPFGTT